MLTRFLAAIAALAALTLVLLGPIAEFLSDIAWGLDEPGPISLDQAYAITFVLLAVLYLAFGVVVAYWSGASGLRAIAVVALSAPLSLGFIWLLAQFMWQLSQSGALESATLAHPSLPLRCLIELLHAGFHLTAVMLMANLLAQSPATHLTSASS